MRIGVVPSERDVVRHNGLSSGSFEGHRLWPLVLLGGEAGVLVNTGVYVRTLAAAPCRLNCVYIYSTHCDVVRPCGPPVIPAPLNHRSSALHSSI